MSGFHPALTGVLYATLAQHEQALAQMQLAANAAQADVDGETAERYAAIIDGLKRMIKAAEPSGYDGSTLGVTEDIRRKHALLGSILSHLTDFKVGSCSISPHYGQGIQINMPFVHKSPQVDVRAALRDIAQRLDLQYGERRHGSSGTTLHAAATGKIQDVDVEIYELVTAERPICDTHGVMVDTDGLCRECPIEPPAGDHLVDADEHDPEPDATVDDDGAPEGRFTDAQLDGTACSECGGDFAEGVAAVPAGLVIDGGQLFAHPDCLTDTTSTEPAGDAP